MNLPATAIDFLDAFHGAFDKAVWQDKLPQVHCYCFQRKDESHAGEHTSGCAAYHMYGCT